MASSPTPKDSTFHNIWNTHKLKFPRLPKFRIRTDIVAESDQVPPRTGVYLPQDDPWGAPQFRWTGNYDGYYAGKLCNVQTFNELGLEAARHVGQGTMWLWDDGPGVLEFVRSKGLKWEGDEVTDEETAIAVLSDEVFVSRPCKWHYVELIEGEYEDTNEPVVMPARGRGLRVASGMPCPWPGVWECDDFPLGLQTFMAGVVMPQVQGKPVTWRLVKAL